MAVNLIPLLGFLQQIAFPVKQPIGIGFVSLLKRKLNSDLNLKRILCYALPINFNSRNISDKKSIIITKQLPPILLKQYILPLILLKPYTLPQTLLKPYILPLILLKPYILPLILLKPYLRLFTSHAHKPFRSADPRGSCVSPPVSTDYNYPRNSFACESPRLRG